MTPRSIRFTDAVSNFGWLQAFGAAIAQIADRVRIDGGMTFIEWLRERAYNAASTSL